MSEKKDVMMKGVAKERVFDNGDSVVNFSLKLSQIAEILDAINKERVAMGLAESEYANFTLRKLRKPTDLGTHYVSMSTWIPTQASEADKKPGAKAVASKSKDATKKGATDDLPF